MTAFFHKLGASLAWDSEESLDYLSYQGFSLDWQYWKRYAEKNTEDYWSADYYVNFRPNMDLTPVSRKAGSWMY
jgi:hypothetical protein